MTPVAGAVGRLEDILETAAAGVAAAGAGVGVAWGVGADAEASATGGCGRNGAVCCGGCGGGA